MQRINVIGRYQCFRAACLFQLYGFSLYTEHGSKKSPKHWYVHRTIHDYIPQKSRNFTSELFTLQSKSYCNSTLLRTCIVFSGLDKWYVPVEHLWNDADEKTEV